MSAILITVDLKGCGVLLANERLSCNITFSNQGSIPEIIAWASAQIHCQACVKEDIVQFPSPDLSSLQSPSNTETTFVPNRGEKGYTVCSTPSSILFCSLNLDPGEVKHVTYSEQLPNGPPSFSGRLIKYSYKLTVGAQKPSCPAQILRIPFRVLVIPETLYSSYISPSPHNSNPFIVSSVKEDPTLELALQALAIETSRRSSLNYTLKNQSGILGKISLYKTSYKLGEDIIGTLDLSPATIACLQMTIILQCVEEVKKESLKPSASLSSVCTVHSKHSECCHNTLQSQFALPIPLGTSQSFTTPVVSVLWQLHFEFLITHKLTQELLVSATPATGFSGSDATMWKSVSPVAMDTMTWDLPVNVLPTAPSQAEPLTQQKLHVLKI